MSGAPDDLADHRPSALAKERASRAGLDLETLKNEAPEQYRMLNAEEVATVSPELAEAAAGMVWDAFPEREIYRVPSGRHERLLAFPPLDGEAFERFDAAAADLVARPEYEAAYAFFRTVRDLRGTHRELMLPVPPDAWHGGPGLVGPFEGEDEAKAWPAGRVPEGLLADPVPYRGRWFCDVFQGDEDLLFPARGGDGSSS